MCYRTCAVAIGLLALMAAPWGCSSQPDATPDPDADGRNVVAVVNYPLLYLAQRIGGDSIDEYYFPAPGDVDPAFWEPTDEDVLGYQRADMILLNGAGYAHWVGHVSLPNARKVDTSAAFTDRLISESGTVHRHGPEGDEHHHSVIAFTTWMNPQLAMLHADAITAAFVEKWPEESEGFESRAAELKQELQNLDDRLTEVNAGYQSQPMFASHPVYQYLSERCQWNLKSLHWEPDVAPDADQWAEFDSELQSHAARLMIWEDAPLDETSQMLADRQVEVVVVRPCGNRPPAGSDWLDVMAENLDRLEKAIARLPDSTP